MRHERARPDRPRRRLLRADGDRLGRERRRRASSARRAGARPNGEHIVIAWTATPIDDVTGREPSLVLLSGIDVTERRRQEEEIRASRTRIIEAADEARRVLERNLHDGAQQRLVALSVSLRLAESRATTDPAERGGDHQRLARGAGGGARGAARARARHPSRRAHRPRPRGGRRGARRPDAVPVDGRGAARTAAGADRGGRLLRRSRRRSRTSSSTRARRRSTVAVVRDEDERHRDRHRRRLRRRRSRRAGTGLRGLRDRVAALDGTLTRRQPDRPGHADRGRDPARGAPGAGPLRSLRPLDSRST